MCSLVSQPCLAWLFHGYTLTQRFTSSSDIWGPPPNSRQQKNNMIQVPHWAFAILKYLWTSLLSSAFCSVNEKQFTSVCKQKNFNNYAENIRYHHSGSQAPMIDAPVKHKKSKLIVTHSDNFRSIRTKSTILQWRKDVHIMHINGQTWPFYYSFSNTVGFSLSIVMCPLNIM
jgi:hypothetical protein